MCVFVLHRGGGQSGDGCLLRDLFSVNWAME